MKKILLLLLLVSAVLICYSQNATIKGNIIDTASRQKLSNAVVVLLHSKDSILYTYSRTDVQGNFQFSHLKSGNYILLITYPKYADYVEHIQLSDSAHIDFTKLILTPRAVLLEAVIVKRQMGAIRLKGDTTEYTADSFIVQPNATVEDLLKKLPGIEVDKNGKLTAQGEKVQKVLVDGEEFFGDDPTLVTQNLRADMVDKVQVYDKKSDQATFTGIDDGKKDKTINLKLKDDKKNGYFGKAIANGGTNGYFDNQLMFNYFKKKLKLAMYGIVSNIGTTGLNWQDNDNYGQANFDYDEEAGNYTYTGENDELTFWNGQYDGQGYPLVQSGGIHFNNKWNDDKETINGNYKMLQLHVNGSSTTNTQFILPDTLYYNNDKQNFSNVILRNKVNGSYEYKIDSSTSIKIQADGGNDHKITALTDSSNALASDSSLVNQALRKTSSIGDNYSVNSNFIYRKKLKKKGRTFSFNFKENYSDKTSTGYLYSNNQYYQKGIISQDTTTDQYKTIANENILLNGKFTYTEPLTNVSSLIFNYGLVVNNNTSQLNSFNKDANNKYTLLDSNNSNNYRFNILTNGGGIAYSLFKKKFKFKIGSNIGYSDFKQLNLFTDETLKRSFVNWYPQTSFHYEFTPQRRLDLEYSGNTQQPTIQQLQPVYSNNNPLNISIGDPALKPSFQNSINLSFFDYKVLTSRNIYISVNYDFSQNDIKSSSYVDSFGRTVTQYVNLNGNHTFGTHLWYGFKTKKELNIGINTNTNSYRGLSIVNNTVNITTSGDYTLGLDFRKEKEKKYMADLYGGATYTTSNSSIQQSIQTNYWQFEIHAVGDIFLPKNFQLHSDWDYFIRQKTSVFTTNTNTLLWNAWFGKKLLKNDALLVKIIANDLLDKNIGFNRSVYNNFISQNTYNTIRRYFLLGVTWNFNKNTGTASGK